MGDLQCLPLSTRETKKMSVISNSWLCMKLISHLISVSVCHAIFPSSYHSDDSLLNVLQKVMFCKHHKKETTYMLNGYMQNRYIDAMYVYIKMYDLISALVGNVILYVFISFATTMSYGFTSFFSLINRRHALTYTHVCKNFFFKKTGGSQ